MRPPQPAATRQPARGAPAHRARRGGEQAGCGLGFHRSARPRLARGCRERASPQRKLPRRRAALPPGRGGGERKPWWRAHPSTPFIPARNSLPTGRGESSWKARTSLVQGPLMSSGLRTFCQRWRHWTSVRSVKYSAGGAAKTQRKGERFARGKREPVRGRARNVDRRMRQRWGQEARRLGGQAAGGPSPKPRGSGDGTPCPRGTESGPSL